ncbi:MAG: hypothetical protein SNJ54_16380 [Anaerolineae bacterium]
MILMNWVRNNDGSFTAFQVHTHRAKLARFIQGQLIAHMQTIYCHEMAALALYQALAARATHQVRRDILLRLAKQEGMQLARRADVLGRLQAPIPGCIGHWGQIRQRVLVWLGPRFALAWIKAVKRGDIRRQIELTRQLKSLSE